jgi:hypothetical protein
MSSDTIPSALSRVHASLRAANLDPSLQSPAVIAALLEHSNRYASNLFTLSASIASTVTPTSSGGSAINKVTPATIALAAKLRISDAAPCVEALSEIASQVNSQPLPLPKGVGVVPLPSKGNCLDRCYDVVVNVVPGVEQSQAEGMQVDEPSESSKRVSKVAVEGKKKKQKYIVKDVDGLSYTADEE